MSRCRNLCLPPPPTRALKMVFYVVLQKASCSDLHVRICVHHRLSWGVRRAGGEAHFPKDTHLNGKVHASPAEAPSSPISAGTWGLHWMSRPLGLAACPGANTSPARLRPFITGMNPVSESLQRSSAFARSP